ncbi:ATP-binding protein [Kitasatospora sp. NPDC050463]|uniref:ATP-binding protein n=1 Tax=Kitasatospora sp. NPDC050463 TaxID=3155786 RepID=UPI0033DCAAA6
MNALEHAAGVRLAGSLPTGAPTVGGRSELRSPRLRRELVLAALDESVAEARRFARDTVALWALDASVVQDVPLVVSELVTNSIRHNSGPSVDFSVLVRVELAREVLAVGVSDPHPGRPVPRAPDSEATHGRGLLLVDAFCDEWIVVPTPDGGKQVCAFWTLPAVSDAALCSALFVPIAD